MSKIINTRIGLKYDLYSKWANVWESFIPLKGEVIFFEVPGSTGAVAQEPAILFKVGDGSTTLKLLPWGQALAADVYSWAKQQSLLGGTYSEGSWSWSDAPEYAQEQAEVAAFVRKETTNIKISVDQVTPENFETIYGIPFDPTNPDHVAKIGKYQTRVSTDNGQTWTVSGEPFDIHISDYVAGNGIQILNDTIYDFTSYSAEQGGTEYGNGKVKVVSATSTTTTVEVTENSVEGWVGRQFTVNAIEPFNPAVRYQLYEDGQAIPVWVAINSSSVVKTIAVDENYNKVSIVELTPDSTTIAKTYQISQYGSVIGNIDIPKDKVVESGSVVDITYSDGHLYDGATDVTEIICPSGTPTEDMAGKYIKLVFANQSTPAYIASKDLVDVYTEGDGIDITSQKVSIKLDTDHNESGIRNNPGSGLKVSPDGLAIDDSLTWILQCGGSETEVSNVEGLINGVGGNVRLTANVNSNQTIPVTEDTTIDLDGKTITGTTQNTIVFAVDNGANLVLKNGNIESDIEAVVARNGSTVELYNCNINSARSNGISALGEGTEVIFNGGSLSSQEAGILCLDGSSATINGGTIEGRDNGAIMGNGTSGRGGTNIVMNGGKLVGKIQTAGYIACAVYIPNNGSFIMNDGEIISDGCGICMRAGDVQLLGGSITANGTTGVKGKVGDSRVVVGPYAVVYDQESNYPGAAIEPFHLTIGENMALTGTDGDIDFVFSSSMSQADIDTYKSQHFTDNR